MCACSSPLNEPLRLKLQYCDLWLRILWNVLNRKGLLSSPFASTHLLGYFFISSLYINFTLRKDSYHLYWYYFCGLHCSDWFYFPSHCIDQMRLMLFYFREISYFLSLPAFTCQVTYLKFIFSFEAEKSLSCCSS